MREIRRRKEMSPANEFRGGQCPVMVSVRRDLSLDNDVTPEEDVRFQWRKQSSEVLRKAPVRRLNSAAVSVHCFVLQELRELAVPAWILTRMW